MKRAKISKSTATQQKTEFTIDELFRKQELGLVKVCKKCGKLSAFKKKTMIQDAHRQYYCEKCKIWQ